MSTSSSETGPATPPTTDADSSHRSLGARIGVDWAAVTAAAVVVLLAVARLLPSIPFLVK